MFQEIGHVQTQIQNGQNTSNVDGTSIDLTTNATTKGKGKEKELPPLPHGGPGSPLLNPSGTSVSTGADPDASAEQYAIDPSTIDPAQWPFEPFPLPPPDGYWLPKFGPPPPSKFPSPPSNAPSTTSFPLFPPLMALTYPPPPPLSETDPTWLFQMVGDVVRQRSHLNQSVMDAEADVANAHVEGALADGELEEEMEKMQEFLNMVAGVAGSGFVRRMLEDVDASIARMSGAVVNDEDEDEDDGEKVDEDEQLYDDSGRGNGGNEEGHNADDEDEDESGDGDDEGNHGGNPEEDVFGNNVIGGLLYPPSDDVPQNDPEETEGPFEQSRSQLEDDGTPKEDAVADKPPCQPPHAEVEEQHPPIDVPKVDPEDFAFSAVQVAEREHQSPKTKHEMIRERFLAKLEEPLDASITQRQSRAVGTRTRVPGIESSRDHGRERRKRSFLAGDEDEDSNHGSDGSSRSKRAKTSHEPSTPTPDGPSRKRSRESMESEDDELDGLDSEEEVSNQVTPRPDRGDPSLTSVADAKGKGKTRAQDDGPGSGSPKRARTDVGPFALVARETKDEKVNWFKEVVAQVSTPSASRQSVASGSRSGSTSKLSSFPPRLPLHLAPPPVPLELRPPSLLIPDIRVNFRGPPRGPPRPLRRETECLRENAFGEPEVYHVHDVHGRQLPSPSPSSSSASSSSRD